MAFLATKLQLPRGLVYVFQLHNGAQSLQAPILSVGRDLFRQYLRRYAPAEI
jgi:hypothetical protein